MAIIWKVKNGAGTERTDLGTPACVEKLSIKLEKYNVLYLSAEQPRFNLENPGEFYRHVVIEVSEEDELSKTFSKIGFYVVKDVDPEQVSFLFNI